MRVRTRVVIVGEAPGRRDSGTTPLYGTGPSAAGWRLRELAGLSLETWREVPRVNLCPVLDERWDRDRARVTAHAWLHGILRRHRVVLLGNRVARAFLMGGRSPFTWERHETAWGGPTLLATMPHPSGRNLFYNDSANRDAARRFLRHALLGET